MKPAQLNLFAEQVSERLRDDVVAAARLAANQVARAASTPRLTGAPDELLTVSQVARILKCDPVHVTNLVDEGALLAVNIASPGAHKRCLRIKAASVTQYLSGNPNSQPATHNPQ